MTEKLFIKRIFAAIVAFAIAFSCIPVLIGEAAVEAASNKPGQVPRLKLTAGASFIDVEWDKVSKNVDGYTIFKYNKAYKNVGPKATKFTDKKVKELTSYTYYVRAYKNEKQKRYYNTSTGKWQSSKPKAGSWKGKKTKTVTVKVYGKASPTLKVRTSAKKTVSSDDGSSSASEPFLNIKFKTEKNIVTIKWKVYDGATGFKLYRNGKLIKKLGKSAGSYVDKGLAWDTEYSYKLEVFEGKTKTLQIDKSIRTQEKAK